MYQIYDKTRTYFKYLHIVCFDGRTLDTRVVQTDRHIRIKPYLFTYLDVYKWVYSSFIYTGALRGILCNVRFLLAPERIALCNYEQARPNVVGKYAQYWVSKQPIQQIHPFFVRIIFYFTTVYYCNEWLLCLRYVKSVLYSFVCDIVYWASYTTTWFIESSDLHFRSWVFRSSKWCLFLL